MTRAELEDRIYELSSGHTTDEMARELGMSWSDLHPIAVKVFEERGTPDQAAARVAIDRLEQIGRSLTRVAAQR